MRLRTTISATIDEFGLDHEWFFGGENRTTRMRAVRVFAAPFRLHAIKPPEGAVNYSLVLPVASV